MKKIAFLVGLIFLVGCLSPIPAISADKISFGFALPLTGSLAERGRRALDSYKLWAKKMNAGGGILIEGKHYPVELVFYDDKSNPDLSARFFEKLVTVDKVDLLLGGIGDRLVSAASVVSEKYKYPMISGEANSDYLFDRNNSYYFSTLPKVSKETRACVDFLKRLKTKPTTVAIIGSDTSPSSLVCEAFKKAVESSGLKIVHYELFPLSVSDYGTTLSKIQAKHPDILFVGTRALKSLKGIVEGMKKNGFMPKAVVLGGGLMVHDLMATLGEDSDYLFTMTEWVSELPYKGPVFGSASDFDKVYYKEYKRHSEYVEAAVASAAVVQQLALQKLGSAPPYDEAGREALMKKLHDIDFETFYGKVRFGKDGANSAHPLVIIQIREGKVVPVYPVEVKKAAPAYPVPLWEKR
ncbi:MAG: amino acid ABC transporter substrate-binding protein [Deltaproteobacteria bacterium]|nr:amino acid ABC transporter substrate-binding protein [Deltaproteobacteria bacterium]